MDKDAMKRLFSTAGLPQIPWLALTRTQWHTDPRHCTKKIEAALKYPLFVKPANLGSSVGISKVHNRAELPRRDEYSGRIRPQAGHRTRRRRPRSQAPRARSRRPRQRRPPRLRRRRDRPRPRVLRLRLQVRLHQHLRAPHPRHPSPPRNPSRSAPWPSTPSAPATAPA